jgi:NADPH:quinone reductase-like Zn-dependent oxidoreductase
MKAMVVNKFGPPDGLELQEVEKPTPNHDEILVKIKATTVTAGDVMVRGLTYPLYAVFWLFSRIFFGQKNLRKRILGHEFAGVVETVGRDVKTFRKGDFVFGTTSGLPMGSHAEYINVLASGMISQMPKDTKFELAAAVPVGGNTALEILRKAEIQANEKILIYGASGSVGTFAIQLAKYFGAEVTAVTSQGNISMVEALGAHAVIDYTTQDFTAKSTLYDVIFDAVGKISKSKCKSVLNPKGRFVSVQSMTKEKRENLIFLKELMESEELTILIDPVVPRLK